MGINKNLKIKEYIDSVCLHIKFKEVHKDIELELQDHIEEMAEDYIEMGKSEDEAVKKAIAQMGNADVIGKQLNKVHKPKPEWSIAIIALLFTIVGLTLSYIFQYKVFEGNYMNDFYQFKRSVFFTVIGIIMAIGLYFFDYKKIKAYSKQMYIGIFIVFILIKYLTGCALISRSNEIQFVYTIPILCALSLSGILDDWNWNSIKGKIYGGVLLTAPIFIFIQCSSIFVCIEYFIVIGMILKTTGIRLLKLVVVYLMAGILFMIKLNSKAYLLERVLGFIDPSSKAKSSGWIYIRIKDIVSSSGIFGKGFNLSFEKLPSMNTDFIFTYIIYTCGWLVAGVFIILVLTLIIRIFKINKSIKDNYGKLIILSFGIIFLIQFIMSILMNVGLFVAVGVSLPFISYGAANIVTNMIMIGIISSIYRRKGITSE